MKLSKCRQAPSPGMTRTRETKQEASQATMRRYQDHTDALSQSMSLLTQRSMRWAAGGWSFFLAENILLSENRTWLIQELGDNRYHLVYGTLSTIATVSIGYAYYAIRKASPGIRSRPSLSGAVVGWTLTSLGLVLASQVGPKLQVPVAVSDGSLHVKCPFDFSESKTATESTVRGLDRISRHPGLWSLGLVGLGQTCLAPSLPARVWWMGPAAVAAFGGAHTDSRFRRGMGGSLDPIYESQTSNLPFLAMISGRQGRDCWQQAWDELKPWNAAIAVGISSLWVLRNVR